MSELAPIEAASAMLVPQPFEAEFLGGSCFRLVLSPGTNAKALGRQLTSLLAEAQADGAKLVTARVPASDMCTTGVLERAGFRRIETLITFERALNDIELSYEGRSVRLAVPADFAACIEIGRSAFHTDRFHADGRIPKQAADALKARWVANSLAGRADASFVALADGRPVGFNLCLKRNAIAVIDLIAVAHEKRGQGVGAALVMASLAHYAKNARVMQVGTQANNTVSIALYRRLGFTPITEAITLHWIP